MRKNKHILKLYVLIIMNQKERTEKWRNKSSKNFV